MATGGEQTAIRVALISAVSAIAVALIANADKFRAPPAPPSAMVREAVPQEPVAVQPVPDVSPNVADRSKPTADRQATEALPARRDPPPVTIRVDTPRSDPPPALAPAGPVLAPGDMRSIPAWGVSNDGISRRFTIRNKTSQPMVRLFIAATEPPRGDDDRVIVSIASLHRGGFGPDRLGAIAVAPGATIAVDADDGSKHCAYDMKAVFADGRELAQNSFNVCAGVNFFWDFGSGG